MVAHPSPQRNTPNDPNSPTTRKYTTFESILKTPERNANSQQAGRNAPSSAGSASGSASGHGVAKRTSKDSSVTGWRLPSVDEDGVGVSGNGKKTIIVNGNGGSRSGERTRSRSRSRSRDQRENKDKKDGKKDGKKPNKADGLLSLWRMMALTVSMGGSQIAWTVELGYGTPYLLSLGLSEQLTSLVWLAGPISGLIAQPLIGAVSDSSRSRYRRRYWIVMATVLLVLSGLGLAFTEDIAEGLVDLFGGGMGGWDPKRQGMVKNTAIGIAVFAFYCLDFALNALQASLRNLVLDITPSEQLASANAWHGRFNHVGNIVGFTMGFLNLANVPIIRLVGGGQFRKVCIVALLLLVLTVWITCWTCEEDEREEVFGERKSKLRDVVSTIYDAVLHLPKPVRRVCIVQIAAFMGWFPYLFYSTTYVAEVMANELGHEPDVDKATRAGSLALLIYSFVAIIAGTLLPYLNARDRRLLKPETGAKADVEREENDEDDDDDEDDEDLADAADMERIRGMVREWKAEAARHGRPLKLPRMPFMLRNIWTAGLVLFGLVMMSTFFIRTVLQATIAIALVGICWAIACWVPFAIIMEFLKEMDDTAASKSTNRTNTHSRDRDHPQSHAHASSAQSHSHPSHAQNGHRPLHARAASTPTGAGAWRSQPATPRHPPAVNERTSLIRSWSSADIEGGGGALGAEGGMEYTGGPVAGGTVMGIHNLAIVFPQFIIAIVASIIFKIADGDSSSTPSAADEGAVHAGKTGVAWVLRFGGLMAFVGALICRKVPPTKTEKAMRRRLAEMQEESEE